MEASQTQSSALPNNIRLALLYKLYNKAKAGKLSRSLARDVRYYVEEVLETRRKKLWGIVKDIRAAEVLAELVGAALRITPNLRVSFLRDRRGSRAEELALDVATERDRFLDPHLRDRRERATTLLREYIEHINAKARKAAFNWFIKFVWHQDPALFDFGTRAREILRKPLASKFLKAILTQKIYGTDRWPPLSRFLNGEFSTWTEAFGLLELVRERLSRGAKLRRLIEKLLVEFVSIYVDEGVARIIAKRAKELGFTIIQQTSKLVWISVEPFRQPSLWLKYLHLLLWASGIRSVKIYIKRPRKLVPNRLSFLEVRSSRYDTRYENSKIDTFLEQRGMRVTERFYAHRLHIRFEVAKRADAITTLQESRIYELLLLLALLLLKLDRLLVSRIVRTLITAVPYALPLLRVILGIDTTLRFDLDDVLVVVGRTPGVIVKELRDPPPPPSLSISNTISTTASWAASSCQFCKRFITCGTYISWAEFRGFGISSVWLVSL